MKATDICSEDDLRDWLREHGHFMKEVSLQWIEPSPLHGSSVGVPDVVMKFHDMKVEVELKYLYRKRDGVKFTLRPAQRRYHHSTMRKGGKTALLYVTDGVLFLVRGDKIPLRDYAAHKDSGCLYGRLEQWELSGDDQSLSLRLKSLLFNPLFWQR